MPCGEDLFGTIVARGNLGGRKCTCDFMDMAAGFRAQHCDHELLQAINDKVLQVKDEFRKELASSHAESRK